MYGHSQSLFFAPATKNIAGLLCYPFNALGSRSDKEHHNIKLFQQARRSNPITKPTSNTSRLMHRDDLGQTWLQFWLDKLSCFESFWKKTKRICSSQKFQKSYRRILVALHIFWQLNKIFSANPTTIWKILMVMIFLDKLTHISWKQLIQFLALRPQKKSIGSRWSIIFIVSETFPCIGNLKTRRPKSDFSVVCFSMKITFISNQQLLFIKKYKIHSLLALDTNSWYCLCLLEVTLKLAYT